MRHDDCEEGLILADQKSKVEECITASEFVDMNMMNWRRIVDMYCYALFKLHATASIFGNHLANGHCGLRPTILEMAISVVTVHLILEPRAVQSLTLASNACVALHNQGSGWNHRTKTCPGELSSEGPGRSDHVSFTLDSFFRIMLCKICLISS